MNAQQVVATRPLRKGASRRGAIRRLQNQVRNAINVSRNRDSKLGVLPEHLRAALRSYGVDLSRISLRAQTPPPGSDLLADYKLWQNGELLFRLKLVPWDATSTEARWHVKRHPEATWWRDTPSRDDPTR